MASTDTTSTGATGTTGATGAAPPAAPANAIEQQISAAVDAAVAKSAAAHATDVQAIIKREMADLRTWLRIELTVGARGHIRDGDGPTA